MQTVTWLLLLLVQLHPQRKKERKNYAGSEELPLQPHTQLLVLGLARKTRYIHAANQHILTTSELANTDYLSCIPCCACAAASAASTAATAACSEDWLSSADALLLPPPSCCCCCDVAAKQDEACQKAWNNHFACLVMSEHVFVRVCSCVCVCV